MAHPRRPDPEQGVFETLLVLDGHPVELNAHLARLKASIEELFPNRAVPHLSQIEVPIENGVMRIDAMPRDDRLKTEISFRGIEQRSEATTLHSLAVPGGLGAHKWRDRSLLDEAQARLLALPLIIDADGAVLEAARANIFAVHDETLFTPPADGRILPGITRIRVLGIAEAMDIDLREKPLTCDDLLSADDVFLSGSVRGIERVESLDGASVRSGGEISNRLGAELQLSWTGAKTAT